MAEGKITVKPAIYTMHGVSTSHSRTDITVRDVSVTTDEPLERNGTNVAASPTETMISALIGCTNNVTIRIAEHKKLNFELISIDADVIFDRRGVVLAEEIEVPVPEITLTITAKTDASAEQLKEMQEMLPIFCPVSRVFQAAGTNVIEKWNIVD